MTTLYRNYRRDACETLALVENKTNPNEMPRFTLGTSTLKPSITDLTSNFQVLRRRSTYGSLIWSTSFTQPDVWLTKLLVYFSHWKLPLLAEGTCLFAVWIGTFCPIDSESIGPNNIWWNERCIDSTNSNFKQSMLIGHIRQVNVLITVL